MGARWTRPPIGTLPLGLDSGLIYCTVGGVQTGGREPEARVHVCVKAEMSCCQETALISIFTHAGGGTEQA